MRTAIETSTPNPQPETFSAGGRLYRWAEGVGHARAEALRGRREALRAAFEQTVLPGLVRRGAARKVVVSSPKRGEPRVWWALWQAPGDARPVWALYASSRCLDVHTTATLGRAANDGAVLVAWGDGPVLAWASEREALRGLLRAALHALPSFLGDGLCSGDATFPVKIVAA
ncbi:MAG: hypothetical protein JNK72_15330 [Myxococcales bacterium]|nr:hypothetical protein [Myxococcales bacterium]